MLVALARRAARRQRRAPCRGYATLLSERSKTGVLTVMLNRPDSMNAYNLQMRDELIDVISGAQDDEKTRCILLTGSGKAFCAGADLGLKEDPPPGFALPVLRC